MFSINRSSPNSPTKPSRQLPSPHEIARSASTVSEVNEDGHKEVKGQQPIYVLSADGSSLFLLDPSKPLKDEKPPPYAPFRASASQPCLPLEDEDENEAGPSSPIRVSSSLSQHAPGHYDERRHRARTLPGLSRTRSVDSPTGATRPRIRNRGSSYNRTTTSVHNSIGNGGSRIRSAVSSPGMEYRQIPTERTPLLGRAAADLFGREDEDEEGEEWIQLDYHRSRGRWRSILCGEVEDGEEVKSWKGGWKRYWRSLVEGHNWRAMVHLLFINFPLALAVWPFLLAGTLVGTVLLITLPLGTIVWWITLFLTRSAARLELVSQVHHHSPLGHSISQPTYRPIFHRIKENPNPESEEIVWEKRFIKCSYAMFSDHFSYSALCYFLLIKPLVVLPSTILVIALFPVCAASIVLFPIYLRAARRWGKYQAGIAVENL